MNLIDLHCDTLMHLQDNGEKYHLKENALCVDLEKLKQAGSIAQFFACFINMGRFQGEDACDKAYEYALQMLERGKWEVAQNANEITSARTVSELMDNQAQGKISAFFTIEEGGIVDGKMDRLEELYEKGIRLITPLWNWENCMGYPNSDDPDVMQRGLKPFGIEAVERMNELGMLVDVSHLSDGGFWDVIKYSKKPVIASHSNARAVCGHRRNLSDEMIRALAEKGGVAGINFYPRFLNGTDAAGIDDLVRHLVHMYHIGGEEFVAMGTDFDGFDDGTNDIAHIGQMEVLYHALKKRKFNDSQIDKIWYQNAMRVIKEVL